MLASSITHTFTRPYRPQTNGKVERYNRTLLNEWAYARPYRSEAARTRALDEWLPMYNHHRHHTIGTSSGLAGVGPVPTDDGVVGAKCAGVILTDAHRPERARRRRRLGPVGVEVDTAPADDGVVGAKGAGAIRVGAHRLERAYRRRARTEDVVSPAGDGVDGGQGAGVTAAALTDLKMPGGTEFWPYSLLTSQQTTASSVRRAQA